MKEQIKSLAQKPSSVRDVERLIISVARGVCTVFNLRRTAVEKPIIRVMGHLQEALECLDEAILTTQPTPDPNPSSDWPSEPPTKPGWFRVYISLRLIRCR